jgi:hypothetical protein
METFLLRYRFDDAVQVDRHFRRAGGRVLLYFPLARLDLPDGGRVLLDLEFTGSQQECFADGSVFARVRAEDRSWGAWLSFPPKVLAGVDVALSAPRRRQRRIGSALFVEARTDTAAQVTRLLDVGPGGARVGASLGARIGDPITLRLLGGEVRADKLNGRICWAGPRETGLRFGGPQARAGLAELLQTLSGLWAQSRVVVHSAVCSCSTSGKVQEPLLPRSWLRRLQ